jgi:glucose-1-phosphate thymidylyltransferase
MNWKGLILAGGSGSRLFPSTKNINKHLLPVYDKPMIYYPLTTMMLAGIRNIVIVSDPLSLPLFRALIGDGSQWGLSVVYRPQDRPAGIADGFRVAADELRGSHVALMLGDNILHGSGLPKFLRYAMERTTGATVLCVEVANPSAYGIVELDSAGMPTRIVEKPINPTSRLAVIGLYFYAPDVLDIAAMVKPSARGELEISDVNSIYLERKRLKALPLGRGFAWLVGGTTGNLFEAGQYVRVMEERTGLKIACPEEIAWRYGLIDRGRARGLAEQMPESDYRRYLLQALETSAFDRNDDA